MSAQPKIEVIILGLPRKTVEPLSPCPDATNDEET